MTTADQTLRLLVTCTVCGSGKPRVDIAVANRTRTICKTCVEAPRACNRCGDVKAADEFYPSRTYPKLRAVGVRDTVCKECVRGDYEQTKANPERFLFDRVRHRATREGTEFTISVSDIFIPEHCPILGIKLAPVGKAEQSAATPSLDRLDSSKGYVPGNVAVVSMLANALKGNGTAAQHERIAAWMRSQGAS
jgi:hypothetical protein